MVSTVKFYRLATISVLVLLSGCIAYAPSDTGGRTTTPTLVLQVCFPTERNGKVQGTLFRTGLRSYSFGWSNPAKARTVGGQEVFDKMLSGPSPVNDAIGILVDDVHKSFYVFEIPTRYSANWSSWTVPISREDKPLLEIDRFKYSRGKKPLAGEELRNAPRLRTRLESPAEYDERSRSKNISVQLPDC